MQNRYFHTRLHVPPQVSAPVSPALEVVVVVPCRGVAALEPLIHQMATTSLPEDNWEIIVVWYTSDWDDESIQQQNMAQFWALERLKKRHPGWAIHGVHFHHLEDATAAPLAIKLGMDEAAYRLEQVHHDRGVVLLWPPDKMPQGDVLASLSDEHARHPEVQMTFFHTLCPPECEDGVLAELSHLYWGAGLKWAGYRYRLPEEPVPLAIRQQGYILAGGLEGRHAEELHLLMAYYQMRDQTSWMTSCMAIGAVGWASVVLPADNNAWLDTHFFQDLKKALTHWPALTAIDRLSAFNHWLQQLPQSIRAFLIEESFPHQWRESSQRSQNVTQFHNDMEMWWQHNRVKRFALQWAPVFYAYKPPKVVLPQLLQMLSGSPADSWSLSYALLQLREHHRLVPTKKAGNINAPASLAV